MKKSLLLIFGIICFALPINAEELKLTGSIVYTVETAKNCAFEGLDLKIDKKIFESHLIDPNNKENRAALANNTQPENRELMSFESARGFVKGYTVVYAEKPELVFYYSTSGYLVAVDIDNQSDNFPYKIGKYHPLTGNLISVGLYISETEQYVYSKNGKLKSHWIGDTAYNEKGEIIAHRLLTNTIPVD